MLASPSHCCSSSIHGAYQPHAATSTPPPTLATAAEDPLAALLQLHHPAGEQISIIWPSSSSSCSQEASFSSSMSYFDWCDMAAIEDHSVHDGAINFPSSTSPSQFFHSYYEQQEQQLQQQAIVVPTTTNTDTRSINTNVQLVANTNNEAPIQVSSSHTVKTNDSVSAFVSQKKGEESLVSSTNQAITIVHSSTDGDNDSVLYSSCKRSPGSPKKKSVVFSEKVAIRTLKLTLGSHPCCRDGMALTCDWERATDDQVMDRDAFEALNGRPSSAFHLNYLERQKRLMEACGFRSSNELFQMQLALIRRSV